MNRYDTRYEIRLATESEIDSVMQFIDQHWSHGHIMAVDKKLFEYEFVDGSTVNVMIALDKNSRTIEAIAGFLPCSHTSDVSKRDIWGSFWKVNDSKKNMTFLGVELIKRLMMLVPCRTHLGIGINPSTTLPIRKIAFHETTARMNHYYRLNSAVTDYKICVIQKKLIAEADSTVPETGIVPFYSVSEIKSRFDIEKTDTIPYKDFWYINKRFFEHPYYSYSVYGLMDSGNQVAALLIMRELEQCGRKVLRIVDYIGDQTLFAGVSHFLDKLMQENYYEYIDFYTYGFHENSILQAGFVLKDKHDPNIIPNYFEPFVQQNVDIWVRSPIESALFCKADGDQDRPNQVRDGC